MFISVESLFKGKSTKQLSDVFETERETLERKKCKNCLQKVKIYYLRCPHCGCTDFHKE